MVWTMTARMVTPARNKFWKCTIGSVTAPEAQPAMTAPDATTLLVTGRFAPNAASTTRSNPRGAHSRIRPMVSSGRSIA